MKLLIILFLLCSCTSKIEVIETELCEDLHIYVEGAVIEEKELILPCGSTMKDVWNIVELAENADISMFHPDMPVYNNDRIQIQEMKEIRISINTAGKEELMQLKGIGEKTAEAIIEYRNTYGLFIRIEDIMNVKGIGEKKYAAIKEQIRL